MANATYALVTGASRGIGKEIAIELARRGHNLILTARTTELLQQLANYVKKKYRVQAEIISGDLENPDTPDKLLRFCQEKNLNVDILVNNAGFGYVGSFEKNDLATYLGMIEVNVKSLVKLTHLFLPTLEKNKQAYLLNVGSVAGFVPQPSSPIYGATKAFVVSFSKSLAYNLKHEHSHVSVTCLCPGVTATEFFRRAGRDTRTSIYNAVMMSPVIVARNGVNGMFAKKLIVFSGISNWLMGSLARFVPDRILMTIMNRFGF